MREIFKKIKSKNKCIICGQKKEDYEASCCDKCWKEEIERLIKG